MSFAGEAYRVQCSAGDCSIVRVQGVAHMRRGCKWGERNGDNSSWHQSGGARLLETEGVTVVELDYESGWEDAIERGRLGDKRGQ